MLFNSTSFLVFFVIVYGLYVALKRDWRRQNHLLLGASLVFYGWWDIRFLFLFLLTTVIDFYCALMIGRGAVPRRERLVASGALIACAFGCTTLEWAALHVHRIGIRVWVSIDWAQLLGGSTRGWLILAGAAAVAAAGLWLHPWLARLPEARRQRTMIVVSVVCNLAVLGFFKYYNFFAESFAQLVQSAVGIRPSAWTLNIVLPVGISFYTFQSMAYTIDVYRGKVQAVERYATLATFLSFFPQLVAGPIERASHLLPQFQRPRRATRDELREGMWLICWGLFKKVVVADNMAVIVNGVFGPFDGSAPSTSVPNDGLRLLLGVYAFALQIYGDFSGYTDIARGTARLLGFDLMLNFNLPYFAISPSDFWQRWHISLSSWLRDYLYIPLGGNRGTQMRVQRNLMVTMLLGGLWHGASWTFVLWGAFHGLILIGYRLLAPKIDDLRFSEALPPLQKIGARAALLEPRPTVTTYSTVGFIPLKCCFSQRRLRLLAAGLVMFHLTCFGWLLFRAQSVTAIGVFLQAIVTRPGWSPEATEVVRNVIYYGWFLVAFQVLQARTGTLDPMKRMHWFLRLNIWIFVLMSLLALAPEQKQAFIYFAF